MQAKGTATSHHAFNNSWDIAGELVKDGYAKLKAMMAKRAPDEVRLLEAQPGSQPRQAMVVEVLDALPKRETDELVDPAQKLVELLEIEATQQPIGVDLTRLSAMNVSFKSVRVASGIGVMARDATLQGDFTIDSLEVGTPPGKAPR